MQLGQGTKTPRKPLPDSTAVEWWHMGSPRPEEIYQHSTTPYRQKSFTCQTPPAFPVLVPMYKRLPFISWVQLVWSVSDQWAWPGNTPKKACFKLNRTAWLPGSESELEPYNASQLFCRFCSCPRTFFQINPFFSFTCIDFYRMLIRRDSLFFLPCHYLWVKC